MNFGTFFSEIVLCPKKKNWYSSKRASVTYECVGYPIGIRLLHDALKYINKRKTTIAPNGFGKW